MADNQNKKQNSGDADGLLGSILGGADSVLTGGDKAKGQGGLLGGLSSVAGKTTEGAGSALNQTTEGVGNTAGSATGGVGNVGKGVTGALDNTVKGVAGSGQQGK
ncbi:hypothetical protein F4820DRAFT_418301 [Hypoxylon rubiginosum]|uniref:Uncharacterized protein n=1 Tax=Hypoxylon rubiginosum TaxID=110542 RepID=A0ACB9Z2K8_9PEZI|nr:hypothetical protein F4820DRAFT_418301 [Hypoxylon rubiginosum]